MDQQKFGNQQAGVDVANRALMAKDAPWTRVLDIEQQRRASPLGNIANLQSLILPMAGLGGTSNTDSYSKSTKQASPVEVAQGWTKVAGNVVGAGNGMKGWF
jgi:hypothetical protein